MMLGMLIILIVFVLMMFCGIWALLGACWSSREKVRIWERHCGELREWAEGDRSEPPPASPNFDD